LRKYPGPHNSCVLETRRSKPGVDPKRPESEVTSKKPTTTPVTTRKPTTTPVTTRKPTAAPPVTTRRPVHADPTKKRTTARPQKTTSTTAAPEEEYEDEDIPELDDEAGCDEGKLFLPHKTDCNRYYQCDHGTLHEKR
jgi:chitinase